MTKSNHGFLETGLAAILNPSFGNKGGGIRKVSRVVVECPSWYGDIGLISDESAGCTPPGINLPAIIAPSGGTSRWSP